MNYSLKIELVANVAYDIEKSIHGMYDYFKQLEFYLKQEKNIDEDYAIKIIYNTEDSIHVLLASTRYNPSEEFEYEIEISKDFLLLIRTICLVVPQVYDLITSSPNVDIEHVKLLIDPLRSCLKQIQSSEDPKKQHYWDNNLLANLISPSSEILFLNATGIILSHEYFHIAFGHTNTPAANDQDQHTYEEVCDDGAARVMLHVSLDPEIDGGKQKHIGAVLGIGSLLFVRNSWKVRPRYPDSDNRLFDIIKTFNEEGYDLWAWGGTLFYIWALLYRSDLVPLDRLLLNESTVKAFAESLKISQPEYGQSLSI